MTRKVIWDSAPVPRFHQQRQPVFLSDQTMRERRDKILARMAKHQLDCLAVYCDLEHGSNFEYLTGFLTRFEESMLLLFKTGQAVLLLGNENTKMVNYSRIPTTMLHVPFFSLPNQPMTIPYERIHGSKTYGLLPDEIQCAGKRILYQMGLLL